MLKIEERPTPNASEREGRAVTTVVLHATGTKGCESPLKWLTSPRSKVSAHYLIGPSGEIWKLAPVRLATWHAGRSVGPDGPGVNLYSVGIELVHPNDGSPYEPEQIAACVELLIRLRWAVPTLKWLTTHAEIAVPPGRKTDPGGFPLGRASVESRLNVWRRQER